jgi:hypothetical protein
MGYEVMSLARTALTFLNLPALSPELRRLLSESDQKEFLKDVTIMSSASVGRPLPVVRTPSCEVLSIVRKGLSVPIDEFTRLQIGDVLTIF